jgi:hypothetical protein
MLVVQVAHGMLSYISPQLLATTVSPLEAQSAEIRDPLLLLASQLQLHQQLHSKPTPGLLLHSLLNVERFALGDTYNIFQQLSQPCSENPRRQQYLRAQQQLQQYLKMQYLLQQQLSQSSELPCCQEANLVRLWRAHCRESKNVACFWRILQEVTAMAPHPKTQLSEPFDRTQPVLLDCHVVPQNHAPWDPICRTFSRQFAVSALELFCNFWPTLCLGLMHVGPGTVSPRCGLT